MDMNHMITSCQSSSSTSSIEVKASERESSGERDSGTAEISSLNCISSSSTLSTSKSLTRRGINSIATSTTTLNQLLVAAGSSCQCINSNSSSCHRTQHPTRTTTTTTTTTTTSTTGNHTEDEEDEDEARPDHEQLQLLPTVDPLDDERINLMREILNKCLTIEIEKRPSASEICDRLAKLI